MIVYEKRTCTTCARLNQLLTERGIDFNRVEYHVEGIGEPRLRNGKGGVSTAPAVVGTIWSQEGGVVCGHVALTVHLDRSSLPWLRATAAKASASVVCRMPRQRAREPRPQYAREKRPRSRR